MTTSSIEFSFEHRGKKFQCFYMLDDAVPQIVRVSTPWGPKEAALAGNSPLSVARLLAGELARDARLH